MSTRSAGVVHRPFPSRYSTSGTSTCTAFTYPPGSLFGLSKTMCQRSDSARQRSARQWREVVARLCASPRDRLGRCTRQQWHGDETTSGAAVSPAKISRESTHAPPASNSAHPSTSGMLSTHPPTSSGSSSSNTTATGPKSATSSGLHDLDEWRATRRTFGRVDPYPPTARRVGRAIPPKDRRILGDEHGS